MEAGGGGVEVVMLRQSEAALQCHKLRLADFQAKAAKRGSMTLLYIYLNQ